MSIPFSVTPALRSGTFTSPILTYQAGQTNIYFEIVLPNASDYNDVTKSITVTFTRNGHPSATLIQFPPGGRLAPGVIPIDYDISQFTAGDQIQISAALSAQMTVGIQNGLIS